MLSRFLQLAKSSDHGFFQICGVSIVIDDGRRWLRGHPYEKFDAIVLNTTWYCRASVTNLLSIELLQMIKQHLNQEGIFFCYTTDSARVQRTGCKTFSYGARDLPTTWWCRNNQLILILIGGGVSLGLIA